MFILQQCNLTTRSIKNGGTVFVIHTSCSMTKQLPAGQARQTAQAGRGFETSVQRDQALAPARVVLHSCVPVARRLPGVLCVGRLAVRALPKGSSRCRQQHGGKGVPSGTLHSAARRQPEPAGRPAGTPWACVTAMTTPALRLVATLSTTAAPVQHIIR
jgi:hypothetical protein